MSVLANQGMGQVHLAQETEAYLDKMAAAILDKNAKKIAAEMQYNLKFDDVGYDRPTDVKVNSIMVDHEQCTASVALKIRPQQFKKISNLDPILKKLDPYKLAAFNYLRGKLLAEITTHSLSSIASYLMCEDSFSLDWVSSVDNARNALQNHSRLLPTEALAVAAQVSQSVK